MFWQRHATPYADTAWPHEENSPNHTLSELVKLDFIGGRNTHSTAN